MLVTVPLYIPTVVYVCKVRYLVSLTVLSSQGCKMVALTAWPQSPLPHGPLEHGTSLRDSAMWYPDIPDAKLCLNEDSFHKPDRYTTAYEPLFWCHFGGPGGMYLPHLTRISSFFSAGILQLRFGFDIDLPAEHQFFGHKGYPWKIVDFSIDGPGGERVDNIVVGYRGLGPGRRPGVLSCEGCPPSPWSAALQRLTALLLLSSPQTATDRAGLATVPAGSKPTPRGGSQLLRAL
jgi:hypothetical protein